MKNIIMGLWFIIFSSCAITSVTNLQALKEGKRNKVIKEISKNAILKYGKEFYQDIKKPKIDTLTISQGENKGRFVYTVTYMYDTTKEKMALDYAAKVFIWADSGKVSAISFGDTRGVFVEKLEQEESEKESGEKK